MDGTCADKNLSNNEFDNNCIDDKVCVYETLISGGYMKKEPCDTEDEQGNIYNYVDIKDEIIEDSKLIIQETGLATNTKETYFICCGECGEKYDLYCLKCPMLIRIFNSNNPNSNDNRVRQTLPKNFMDIRETPSGVGIVALRAIPKGTVFGPFEGLDSTKEGPVSKWKLENKKLVYAKDPKRLNWMQYIRTANATSHQNLTPFQYEDGLYYRSDCHISVGDELLVCWDSGSEDNEGQDMVDGYWKPQACERLDDTYACTLCCVGYKSICHLAAHNSRCREKGNQKDFCKEVIQCAFCKIYLDEEEYSEYHIDRCCESNPKKYVAAPRSPDDTQKPELKDKHKCSMCEYSTSRRGMLAQHRLTHTDLRMYKCPECPYRTSRKHSLQKHVGTHAKCSYSICECEHCGERFTRSDLFAIHQKKEHSVSAYKCDKCIFETMNARNFVRHQATHKVAKPYRCNTCGKQFNLEKTLLRHVRDLHNERRKEYKCSKCNFETIYPGSIKKHLLNIHGGVKRFKCPSCNFKTCSKEHLERHLRYHDDVKPIKCESCHIEFWNPQLLVRHKKEVHAISDKIYNCSKCEYRTHRYYVFKQHLIRVHDGPKNFACTLCPYKTTANSNLKRHIATHNDDKPFACTLCPYKTTVNSNLKQHVEIHGNDKPFACALCPYKATKKSTLKQHLVTHNDDKPFKCSLCPYKTALKSTLKRHVAIHGDDKPFACTLCPYKTTVNSVLKRHVAIHNDKPFKCNICLYSSTTNWNLQRHIAITHNDDKPFKCDVCPEMFKHKSYLTKHARSMHSKVEKVEYECPE